jgi:hypothetical protein
MSDTELAINLNGELEKMLFRLFNLKGWGSANQARQLDHLFPPTIIEKINEVSRVRNLFAHSKRKRFQNDLQRKLFVENVTFIKEELQSFKNLINLPASRFAFINKQYNQPIDSWKNGNEPWQVHCWHDWHKGKNQRFAISHTENNDGCIISMAESGHCLDTYKIDGKVKLHFWKYHGGQNQRWKITWLEDYSYKIESLENGLCVDAWRMEDNSVIVHLWEWHGGDNQRWWLNPYL